MRAVEAFGSNGVEGVFRYEIMVCFLAQQLLRAAFQRSPFCLKIKGVMQPNLGVCLLLFPGM